MEQLRQRGGASIYGGETASMNAQTYMDVRVIADFYVFLREHGSITNSISGTIKESIYWLHEMLIKEGQMKSCKTVEQAVHILESAGFSMRQIKTDRRNLPVVKGLQREAMRADFSGVDMKGSADVLLSEEENIRRTAERFLSVDERSSLEKEALSQVPSGIVIDEE